MKKNETGKMATLPFLTREAILAADDLIRERVDIPE